MTCLKKKCFMFKTYLQLLSFSPRVSGKTQIQLLSSALRGLAVLRLTTSFGPPASASPQGSAQPASASAQASACRLPTLKVHFCRPLSLKIPLCHRSSYHQSLFSQPFYHQTLFNQPSADLRVTIFCLLRILSANINLICSANIQNIGFNVTSVLHTSFCSTGAGHLHTAGLQDSRLFTVAGLHITSLSGASLHVNSSFVAGFLESYSLRCRPPHHLFPRNLSPRSWIPCWICFCSRCPGPPPTSLVHL